MSRLTEGFYQECLWVWTGGLKGYEPGSFFNSLLDAYMRADRNNKARLDRAFPEVKAAWERYQEEGA